MPGAAGGEGRGGAPCGRHTTCIYLRPGLECRSPLSPCEVNAISLLVCLTTVCSFLSFCCVSFSGETSFPLGCIFFLFFLWSVGGAAAFVGQCSFRPVSYDSFVLHLFLHPKQHRPGFSTTVPYFHPSVCTPSVTGFPCGGLCFEGPTLAARWRARPVCLRWVAECRRSHVRIGCG